jgi:hypothetical protein
MIQDAVELQEKDIQLLCFTFWEILNESRSKSSLKLTFWCGSDAVYLRKFSDLKEALLNLFTINQSSQAKQQIKSQAKGRKGRKRWAEDQENKEDICGDHVEEDNMKGASLFMTKQIDVLSILGRFVET